jgi:transposase
MLADRREALTRRPGADCVSTPGLLAELLPWSRQTRHQHLSGQGDAGHRSAALYRRKDRRRIAVEELTELIAVETKIKKVTAELTTMDLARESRLLDIHGVGAVVTARILGDVGNVARFDDRNRFGVVDKNRPLGRLTTLQPPELIRKTSAKTTAQTTG